MKAPVAIPLIGLITGILFAMYGAGVISGVILTITAILIWLIVNKLTKDPAKGFSRGILHQVWILIAFAGCGIISFDLCRPYRFQEGTISSYAAASGIISAIRHSTYGDILTVEVGSLINRHGSREMTDNLTIFVRSDAVCNEIDDEILFPVELKPITQSPNHFDSGYVRMLHNKGIYYETECPADRIIKTGNVNTLRGASRRICSRIESVIENSTLAKESRQFLITVLLGDRAYLDRESRDIFADAGVSHMLALSGMHVGIIAGIVLWLLFPINFTGRYKIRLAITCVILIFYAFITGFAPSTVRACLMTISMVIGIAFERKNSAWNSLLIAVFIILVISPSSLSDPGLQLSFMCVASLIFFANPLNPINQHEHPRLYRMSSLLIATLVTTGTTWCLTAWYFGTIPSMFLIANIIVLPLFPIFMILSIFHLLLSAFGADITFMSGLIDMAIDSMRQFLLWLSDGGESVITYRPDAVQVVIWIALIIMSAVLINSKRNGWKNAIWVACATAFVMTFVFPAKADAMEAFILQSGKDKVSILYRDNKVERTMHAERGAITRVRLGSRSVMIVDRDTRSLAGRYKCDILLLGSGCHENLELLVRKIDAGELVIHQSVRRKRERELMRSADSLSIRAHSIRLDGPYRHSNPSGRE